MRAQRAGFKLVCAKGAWLHHIGAGYIKQQSIDETQDIETVHQARMQIVQAAYYEFRKKWDTDMPEIYNGVNAINFKKLREKKVSFNEYQNPIKPELRDCESL